MILHIDIKPEKINDFLEFRDIGITDIKDSEAFKAIIAIDKRQESYEFTKEVIDYLAKQLEDE